MICNSTILSLIKSEEQAHQVIFSWVELIVLESLPQSLKCDEVPFFAIEETECCINIEFRTAAQSLFDQFNGLLDLKVYSEAFHEDFPGSRHEISVS